VNERLRHPAASTRLRALLHGCLLAALCLFSPPHGGAAAASAAQSAGGWVSGTVSDEDGAVIAGASITAFNPATGLERRTATNGEGYFAIPLLPAGRYSVTVQRDGFKTVDVRDVPVSDGNRPALRVRLTVGDVQEYVVVMAEGAGRVGAEDDAASVSVSFGAAQVENLPLSGGSLQSLLNLVPGAVVTKTNFNEQGQFSVNGQRANANYFTVDGVSANFGVSAGPAPGQAAGGSLPALSSFGGTNNLVSAEAVQELRVETFTYAAEFGRTPGGQVTLTTRSGTNEFHGTAFYNLRRRALDADDWFVNARGLPKPPSRHDDFGGVLGGPVVRNRTFFFLSYERLSLLQPRVAVTGVPSEATRNQTPPQLKPLVEAFPRPAPNGRDLGFGMTELAASYGEPSSLSAAGVRVDHVVSNGLSLFARYARSPSRTAQRGSINPPTPTARETFGGSNQFRQSLSTVNESSFETRTLTFGSSFAVSPRLTGDARFNWSRASGSTFYRLDDFGGAIPPPDSYLFPPSVSPGDGLIQIVSIMPLGQAGNLRAGKDADNVNRQLNAAGVLNVVRGAHRFKLGADYRRLSPVFDAPAYTQTVTFFSFGDTPQHFATVVSGTAGEGRVYAEAEPRELVFHNLSLFAQDEWRLGPRLAISYGLRWELNPPPREGRAHDPAVVRGVSNGGGLLSPLELAPAGTPLWETTYGNFAPRVGVAYRLRRETTLRVGAGIFYDLGTGQGAQAFGSVFPFTRVRKLGAVPFPLRPADAAPPTPGASPGVGTLFAFDPHLKLPYVRQWSVTVEQPFGAGNRLSLAYLGAQGRRLLREDAFGNLRIPGGSAADTVVYTSNSAESDYHAVQAQFVRRLSKGLEGFAAYTWAHSTDTASDDSSLRFSPDDDRGASNFDVRHTLSAALTYQPPALFKGKLVGALARRWSADALVRWRSATPVDVTTVSGLLSGGLVQYSRPYLREGVPVYVKDPGVPGGMFINQRAFTSAPGAGERLGRNALRGFGAAQVDLTLRRRFELGDRLSLQLRAEVYNLFNHPNFDNPSPVYAPFNDPVRADPTRRFVSTQTLGQSLGTGGTFGGLIPMYQLGGARSVQLGAKLQF
jgi:hypothetical protein